MHSTTLAEATATKFSISDAHRYHLPTVMGLGWLFLLTWLRQFSFFLLQGYSLDGKTISNPHLCHCLITKQFLTSEPTETLTG